MEHPRVILRSGLEPATVWTKSAKRNRLHPGRLIGTLFSKYTLLNRLCCPLLRGELRWRLSGRRVICLGEGLAGRWVNVILFDVWRVDRPADEAPQADVPGRRSLNLELIRGRNTTVASRNALWTRCADGALSLAARMWQATP